MKFSSPTSLLLNLGHALDHWVLVIFLYTVSVIAGVWGADWHELTPYAFGASFMFGAGSIVSGKLGDQWGRRAMMIIFFVGMGLSCLVIALCQNKWQIGLAMTLMGAFASIYHPVGIPMLVQRAEKPGLVIGVNGLVGNLGIAIGSSVSVLLATRYGWQMAYIVPGVVCLVASVLFAAFVPREEEAPAKRKSKVLDLPPNVMARVFFIMTCAAVSGSIVFNFTTNSNGEMLKARLAELAANPWLLSMVLVAVFTVASIAQIAVGLLIDRFPLKTIYLPILLAQIPLFIVAAYAEGWSLVIVTTLFMVFVFGAIPFTDAMIVRFVDDRMRSRVTGMRLAIGFGVSSLVVAAIGPSVKAAGFPILLLSLSAVAACTMFAISFLPNERHVATAALKPAE
ncbi:MAG: MFS transporter [Proteobacteria bacterium]|nr:MFS transporter [Pseudomonadota bacterium]